MLLNFGGPRDLDEVQNFLYEILRDPNTIQLPAPHWMQNRFARFIASRRVVEISRQYGVIGGRSPLVEATGRIATALTRALASRSGEAPPPVVIAHRYLAGHARAAVEQVMALHRESPVDAILALPLYPHFSYASSGSSFQQLHGLLAAAGWKGRLWACRSYPDAPGYIDAMAARLDALLTAVRPPPETTVILCSAHGLPKAYLGRGDPYLDELHRTLEPLRGRFPGWRFELSFQSRVGPAEWLKPYTDKIIPQLAGQGVRHLVFVPLAFVNDHLETLYEVGVTYFNIARAHGITPHRVPAVEDHPAYIQMLARAVAEWLEASPLEASPLEATPLEASPLEASPSPSLRPVEELLPPSQTWRRHGPWLAALGAALALAGGISWWIG